MLPIMLDLTRGPVILYGDGAAALRRLELLRGAGAGDIHVFSPGPPSTELKEAAAQVRLGPPSEKSVADAIAIFVVDTPDADEIVALAHRHKTLVNVEDDIPYCDFFMPSVVRRGDLVISISTNGQSPGLARQLRKRMEQDYGPEWEGRLERLGAARAEWRAEGLGMSEVSTLTHKMIESEGWL